MALYIIVIVTANREQRIIHKYYCANDLQCGLEKHRVRHDRLHLLISPPFEDVRRYSCTPALINALKYNDQEIIQRTKSRYRIHLNALPGTTYALKKPQNFLGYKNQAFLVTCNLNTSFEYPSTTYGGIVKLPWVLLELLQNQFQLISIGSLMFVDSL